MVDAAAQPKLRSTLLDIPVRRRSCGGEKGKVLRGDGIGRLVKDWR
jgi:hypothetical protein